MPNGVPPPPPRPGLGAAHRHPEHEDYRPLKGRRRLLVAALGLCTAFIVMWSVLEKPGGQLAQRAAAASAAVAGAASQAAVAAVCANGKGTGCVGGTSQVLLMPTVAPAAAASSGR
jgi:hypothetical protein